jgi:hypothetical protein
MKKALGSILATGLGLLLLVYTASRSFDFIAQTLDPSRAILAYFALAALDGGLLAWLLNYMHGARGGMQRAISIIMVLVDFTGIAVFFTLDTLLDTGKAGMTVALDPASIQTAVFALSVVIAANIGAVVMHHLSDPETRRRMAEEEAQGKITEATLKRLDENSDSLAAQLAPILAKDWMEEIRARNTSTLKLGKPLKVELPVLPQELPVSPDEDTSKPANPTSRRKAS